MRRYVQRIHLMLVVRVLYQNQSVVTLLDSESYEDCIRLAVSLGGDTDTQAAIAGSIAQAFFYGKVPFDIEARAKLCILMNKDMINVVDSFHKQD